jgi:NAD(P)-dependent dehydrogenase (short-subunit alcohol dehydrogenase family)
MKRPTGKFFLDTFFARKTMEKVTNQDLTGKMVVFTGGTDGMGRAALNRFVEMGADICLLGRNPQKTKRVADELLLEGKGGQVSIVECDLGSLEQVRRAAREVLERCQRIDYLINCAGINASTRQLTPDGYEMNFVVNYLGPFLLTELLLERTKTTPDARILHLTSATQEVADLKFDDLQSEKKWSMLSSYAQAKLCMIMHGRDLATRLEGSGVTVNSLNPGYIQTNLSRYSKGMEGLFTKLFGGLAAPTWVGAERIVAAVLEDKYQNVSGKFIYEDMLLAPNPQALVDEDVTHLMQVSRQMANL